MSYILDALRKSETERHQGKVPDLGRQLQLIHRPPRRRLPLQAWLIGALLVNAAVLGAVFWPQVVGLEPDNAAQATDMGTNTATRPSETQESVQIRAETNAPNYQPPTVIVPSQRNAGRSSVNSRRDSVDAVGLSTGNKPVEGVSRNRVPHLVELPLSFQRSVPNLTVNSHIFASAPQARRVMINNQNLRPGDRLQSLQVDAITEDGVVLSKQGQSFRLGIVRDWVSPR